MTGGSYRKSKPGAQESRGSGVLGELNCEVVSDGVGCPIISHDAGIGGEGQMGR